MKKKLIFKKYCILLAIAICCLVYTPGLYADESVLFTSVAPEALIVLDLSGSMKWAPAGEYMYISDSYACDESNPPDVPYYGSSGTGHTQPPCEIDADGTVPQYSDGSCSGPFYINNLHTGYATDCSRIAIAKRAIFDILDDNNDNTVDDQDEEVLNVRIGYMRFHDGNDTAGIYTKDNNKLIEPLGTVYSTIWSSVNSDTANSGTPLAYSLSEAKAYLDYHKTKDAAAACRQKFVILITDGEDTYSCSGDGTSGQTDQYKRRRETVAKVKALADAGYKVFIVGFGADMPDGLKNTLSWAAYYGNTDNPVEANSGDTSTNAYDPSAITSCQESTTSGGFATSNDPGKAGLSGYAFLASSADELTDALKQAINIIREATYSFSMSSIQTSRTTDENYLYEASFEPVNNCPFWLGHLKKYAINDDGSVGSEMWDAGEVLKLKDASSRTIYTYTSDTSTSGSQKLFITSSITPQNLGLAGTETAQRDAIVGYIRGETACKPVEDNWKLGDIFRSAPVTIATPSFSYNDTRDSNSAFAAFRTNNERTSANGKRTIVIGANDGQIHAFLTGTGEEKWSFIPPNMLSKLKNIAHSSHPTGLTHQYFADGPVMVADVWLGTGDGTGKSADDWKTLMIFGEGRGGISRLWSSSSSCDSGFSENYSATYPYYGGYYCLDVTDPLNPVYKWRINPTASESPYIGDPWGKVFPGKVTINGEEKWVGFMGGGYNAQNCVNMSKCDERGKGFFVIDLSSGDTLWSVTLADNSSMIHSITATPSVVDTDNDGFIDTAYVGDLGGSMWRFKFCRASDGSTCTTSDWSAGVLFQQATSVIRPIYTSPAVSKDLQGNLWVYWGTGDKEDPTASKAQEVFFGLKDNDRSTTWAGSDLENITSGTYDPSSTSPGWYMNFAGGEKVLGDPLVFGGVVYFTTFTPDQSGDPCSYGGDAQLYGVDSVTGAGEEMSEEDPRSMNIGTGIPTAPVISLKPGTALSPDLYVTVSSGGGGGSSSTQRVSFDPPSLSNRTNMLFWFDKRLQ